MICIHASDPCMKQLQETIQMSPIQAEKPSPVINISVEFVSLKRIEKHGSNEQNTVINCQGLGDMNGEMPFL